MVTEKYLNNFVGLVNDNHVDTVILIGEMSIVTVLYERVLIQ